MKNFLASALLTLALFLVSCLPTLQAQDVLSPDLVVKKVYEIDAKQPDTTASVKAYLTPELYKLIRAVENKPVPQGDIGDIEGDIFTDAQDDYTKLEVKPAQIHEAAAQVKVTMAFGQDVRNYVVSLKLVKGKWKIDDIDWGGNRTLRKMMIGFAPKSK